MRDAQQNTAGREPRLLALITEPDPRLHIPSLPIAEVTDEIRQLMDDMLHSMYYYGGIGLAAVQVGVLQKIVVIDIRGYAKRGYIATDDLSKYDMPLFMANPEIITHADTLYIYREGCLSFPSAYAEVERPSNIKVRFLDYNGVAREMEVEQGILSVCIQHEIDHTNGIVFVDHLSRIKRGLLVKKVIKHKAKQAALLNEQET